MEITQLPNFHYGDRECPFGCPFASLEGKPHVDKVRKYDKGSLPVTESVSPKVFTRFTNDFVLWFSLPVFTEPPDGLVEQYEDWFSS